MDIKEINFAQIDKDILEGNNVIYGAGAHGKLLYNKLRSKGVRILGFYDDYKSARGGDVYGEKLYTQSEVECLDKKTNIIISSMYVPKMVEKARKMSFSNIFISVESLLENDDSALELHKYQGSKIHIEKLKRLGEFFKDDKSKQYFTVMMKTIEEGKALPDICKICTDEPQYFLDCFAGCLDNMTFLDAGAYTGDTLYEMIEIGIRPLKVYCFEANKTNFEILQHNASKYGNVIAENYALWDKKEKLKMKWSNYNARISEEGTGECIEAKSIDVYFKDIHVDFIKMDIEGAERHALAGGWNILRRDRPILAISIYHGLDDIVDIPHMLIEHMEDYDFIVRHHSYSYSETVMYGVPREKGIKIV